MIVKLNNDAMTWFSVIADAMVPMAIKAAPRNRKAMNDAKVLAFTSPPRFITMIICTTMFTLISKKSVNAARYFAITIWCSGVGEVNIKMSVPFRFSSAKSLIVINGIIRKRTLRIYTISPEIFTTLLAILDDK